MFESLGFKLEYSEDSAMIKPLLLASHVEPLDDLDEENPSEYALVTTRAGGVAACAGWTRLAEHVVLHSLAVAPPSRGSGVGAALLAHVMGQIMDQRPVEAIYLSTSGARRFFSSFGFVELDESPPQEVAQHGSFRAAQTSGAEVAMVKHYRDLPRGLAQCAFRVIHNATADAALPHGSVIFIRQIEAMLEGHYRGGVVRKGHLLGHVQPEGVDYLWQSYLSPERLAQGHGKLTISVLDDGRRELKEQQGAELTLWLREA